MSDKEHIVNRLKISRDAAHQSMAQAGEKIAKEWAEKHADYDELRRLGATREERREFFEKEVLGDPGPLLIASLALGEIGNEDFPIEEMERFWSEVGATPKQYNHPAFLRGFVLAVEAFWREYSQYLDDPEEGAG